MGCVLTQADGKDRGSPRRDETTGGSVGVGVGIVIVVVGDYVEAEGGGKKGRVNS